MMAELGSLLERDMRDIRPADYTIADVARRRDRRRRNKRIGSAVIALIIAAAAIGALVRAFGLDRSSAPADWPSPSGTAAPLLHEGEVVQRPPAGQTLVATDTATGHERTITRCQGCVFISQFAPSADDAWVAFDVVTCGGACTPAKLAKEGIWIVGADGHVRHLTTPCGQSRCFEEVWSWSPSVPQLAYAQTREDGSDLFLLDPANGSRTRIATTEGAMRAVAWAPDGSSIAYSVVPLSRPFQPVRGEGSTGVYIVRSGQRPVRITEAVVDVLPPDPGITWSPDGTRLALEASQGGRARLVIIGVDGSDGRTVLDGPAFEGTGPPVRSPDGRKIAYFDMPGEQGDYAFDVGVVGADGGQPVRLVRVAGSQDAWDGPVWSPDSRLVAFAVGDLSKWLAAPADGSGEPTQIDRLEVLRWKQGARP